MFGGDAIITDYNHSVCACARLFYRAYQGNKKSPSAALLKAIVPSTVDETCSFQVRVTALHYNIAWVLAVMAAVSSQQGG